MMNKEEQNKKQSNKTKNLKTKIKSGYFDINKIIKMTSTFFIMTLMMITIVITNNIPLIEIKCFRYDVLLSSFKDKCQNFSPF